MTAMPYRGGSTLVFERKDGQTWVSLDGAALQPAWLHANTPAGLDALRRELERGSRGFAVLCAASKLATLPPLPAGRDLALGVAGDVADPALLKRHSGVTGLTLTSPEDAEFDVLAAFPDLTSLRLFGWPKAADLRPLARLTKLAWLRLSGPKLDDLSPLIELRALRGLELSGCSGVTSLSPLGRMPNLESLRLSYCKDVIELTPLAKLSKLRVLDLRGTGVTDLSPLAGLTQLAELDISTCAGVTDLAPLHALIRRGCDVRVPARLAAQLARIRTDSDF